MWMPVCSFWLSRPSKHCFRKDKERRIERKQLNYHFYVISCNLREDYLIFEKWNSLLWDTHEFDKWTDIMLGHLESYVSSLSLRFFACNGAPAYNF